MFFAVRQLWRDRPFRLLAAGLGAPLGVYLLAMPIVMSTGQLAETAYSALTAVTPLFLVLSLVLLPLLAASAQGRGKSMKAALGRMLFIMFLVAGPLSFTAGLWIADLAPPKGSVFGQGSSFKHLFFYLFSFLYVACLPLFFLVLLWPDRLKEERKALLLSKNKA